MSSLNAFALEPNEILVLVNKNCPESIEVGKYYCEKRNVSAGNIVELDLKWPDDETISRDSYDYLIAIPVRKELKCRPDGQIACFLTTYGIPTKVDGRKPLENQDQEKKQLELLLSGKIEELSQTVSLMNSIALLPEPKQEKNGLRQSQVLIQQAQKAGKEAIKRIESMRAGKERDGLFFKWLDCYEKLYGKASSLKAVSQHSWLSRPLTTEEQQLQLESLQGHVLLINSAEQEKWPLAKRLQKGFYGSLEKTSGQAGLTSYLQTQIDRLAGRESLAAVDSELSMVLYEDYELCQWQPNELKDRVFMMGSKTMMVSRLDGPSAQIAKGLVDKSMTAEKNGVKGKAYFDQRMAPDTKEQYWMALYDNSVAEAAETVKNRTGWKTELESTPALFKEGQCPDTALYCGWYSLRKYIPSFTFVTGAIGYHIASFEAIHIRDANNSEWCANLLKNGITATLGPVAEPYLHAFPEPKAFFSELLDGSCLVEAYYRTLPFNSWQIMLIGDPLYTFKIKE